MEALGASVSAFERRAQNALVRWLGTGRHLVAPNVYLAGHEWDLAVLTRAGYLWEIEIKASNSDWNADKRKTDHPAGKPQCRWDAAWGGAPSWVTRAADRVRAESPARLYYCVPLGLEEHTPRSLDPRFGILTLDETDRVRCHRKPRALHKEPAPEFIVNRLAFSMAARYWYARCYPGYTSLRVPENEPELEEMIG